MSWTSRLDVAAACCAAMCVFGTVDAARADCCLTDWLFGTGRTTYTVGYTPPVVYAPPAQCGCALGRAIRAARAGLHASNNLSHCVPAGSHRDVHAGHVRGALLRLRGDDVSAETGLDLLRLARALPRQLRRAGLSRLRQLHELRLCAVQRMPLVQQRRVRLQFMRLQLVRNKLRRMFIVQRRRFQRIRRLPQRLFIVYRGRRGAAGTCGHEPAANRRADDDQPDAGVDARPAVDGARPAGGNAWSAVHGARPVRRGTAYLRSGFRLAANCAWRADGRQQQFHRYPKLPADDQGRQPHGRTAEDQRRPADDRWAATVAATGAAQPEGSDRMTSRPVIHAGYFQLLPSPPATVPVQTVGLPKAAANLPADDGGWVPVK